jgi:plastocyanin
MTISVRGRVLALTFLVALVAAACGGNSNDASSGATSATGGSSSSGGSGSSGGSRYGGNGDETGATGAMTGDSGGDGTQDGPTVQANNFAFDPTTVKVESGGDLYLANGNANTPHTFTVDGTDIDVSLDPLASDEVKIDLDPGTYDFHCKIHTQMTGTLTVT